MIRRKNRKDALIEVVEEKQRNFENNKNRTSKDNSSQRLRYRFPKHETKDQLENLFVFDLETYIDE